MFDKDDRVFWIRDEAELVRGPESEPLYWQGIMTDITERKKTENELPESEQRFRQLSLSNRWMLST